MNDLLELWLKVYAFDVSRYLLGAGIVSFVLFVLLRRFSAGRRIQARTASATDIRREIFYSLTTVGVYASVALVTVHLKQSGVLQFYDDWTRYPLVYSALSLPVILILQDTYFYWVHRMMHHRRLFRLFHLAHHRSHTPTPWAAYAFAPGEAVLMALFVPVVTFLIPVHEIILFIFLSIMIVRNAMGHSGIEFHHRAWIEGPWDIFTSTTHHDMHHQRVRGNYGLYFTWWDRWMGTEFPDYREQFYRAVDGEKTTIRVPSREVVA
ncbi:MAG: sterol desaturase family protein [Halioglobus sp.]